MPMREELASPALRSWQRRGSDEVTWRDVGEAFNSLDPRIVIFSVSGLLATLLCASLAPFAAFQIAAAVAQVF
ncbi:MAG: hypothetical protein WBB34_14305 [Xanthobacteraceae bacterium]